MSTLYLIVIINNIINKWNSAQNKFLKMEINPKVYAHAKNLYVRAIFSHRGNFCAIIEAEKRRR